ncbi:MAG: glycosyltransferase [Anaerolineae bacterium]|jgi:sterol 3beta-glucosyltransferase
MRITINAFGSRGDVQPYVALGKGFKEAGHDVRLTTHRIFEALVLEHNLDFFPMEGDPRQVLLAQAVAELGNNPFRVNRWIAENFKPALKEVFHATLDAAQGADLLLNSALSFAGWHVAQKLDIPSIGAYLQPTMPTRAFHNYSAPLPPSWLPFKGLYNVLSTKLTNQSFFYMLRPPVNACRREVLDLPPLSAAYYWRLDSASATVPIIYGYSPSVIPRPPDWGDYQQITGYWFLDGAQNYEPPAELADFLESGPPPVYVGFGSMVDHEREDMTRLVVEAMGQAGQRAILLSGWSDLGSAVLPDFILRIDFVPHDWLFPRVAAVVHHGGAGTTAAGLRAGVPNVVIPFFADQPFWGWRVHKLAVGPKWILRKKLTAAKLAAAIRQAVNDSTMIQRAEELGKRIRAEDGVRTAVQLVEQQLPENKSSG